MVAKAQRTAALVRAAKHVIVFTGAGISTSAGIPDYRGPDGVWTRKDKGLAPPTGTPMHVAMPTYTHRAIKALVDAGIIKHVISQNVDGLHLRSGVPRAKMSELHGNTYLAKCWGCGWEKLSDRRIRGVDRSRVCKECRSRVPHFCHCADMAPCERCGGVLKDSIIHFGENLPEKDLSDAFEHAGAADLCMVLGSSCKVTPAADVPETVGNKKGDTLVIVNLQPTPLDELAALCCAYKIDDFMSVLMGELGIAVPPPATPAETRPTRAAGAAEPAVKAAAAAVGGAGGSPDGAAAAASGVGGLSLAGGASPAADAGAVTAPAEPTASGAVKPWKASPAARAAHAAALAAGGSVAGGAGTARGAPSKPPRA